MVDHQILKGNVNQIDFHYPRPDKIRAMLYQPEWNPEDWKIDKGLYFLKSTEKINRIIEKATTIAHQKTVDLLVFPELSIPETAISTLVRWSTETKTTVIAGSHYHLLTDINEDHESHYISRCPVIIDGKVYFVHKYCPSPHERSAIDSEGLHPGSDQFLFLNTNVGNFAVMICSDFLDTDARTMIPFEELDLCIVPAFQSDSNIYYKHMDLECTKSSNGIYFLYANNVLHSSGDGGSSVFGLMDRLFLEKLGEVSFQTMPFSLKSKESHLILKLDLKNKIPSIARTVKSSPNIMLLSEIQEKNDEDQQFIELVLHNDERYEHIDEYFVPPQEYSLMEGKLDTLKILFIIGDPGIGKTYCAAKLLKQYFKRGYQPVWFLGLDRQERETQRKILEGLRPVEGKVMYFEDPFGRTVFENRDSLRNIFGPLIDRIKSIDTRIIVTSRREIFEQFLEESLTYLDLKAFCEELNVIKPSYLPSDLEKILIRLGRLARWKSNDECLKVIKTKIMLGYLRTPLAIKDFVSATEEVDNVQDIINRLEGRRVEEKNSFVQDMTSAKALSKLYLSCIFFFGNQPQSIRLMLFNAIAAKFNSDQQFLGASAWNNETRRQLGYRTERFGTKAVIDKFIHPMYEEAFARLILKDSSTQDIVLTLIEHAANFDIQLIIMAVLQHAAKYEEVTTILLRKLIAQIKIAIDLSQMNFIGLQIIRAYNKTRNEEYLKILIDTISPEEIVKRILVEQDIERVTNALRLLYNYKLVLAHTKMRITNDIWHHKIKFALENNKLMLRWRSEKAVYKIMDCLYWSFFISTRIPREYFDDLNNNEKSNILHALDLQAKTGYGNLADFLSYGRFIKIKATHAKPKKRIRAKDWLLLNANSRIGVYIDEGAVRAIEKKCNLLPVGVIGIEGGFDRFDSISIFDAKGMAVGIGITNYNSEEVNIIKGKHSSMVYTLLPLSIGRAVISTRNIALQSTGHSFAFRISETPRVNSSNPKEETSRH